MSQFWYQRITDSDNDAEEAFNYRTIGNQADFHENECLFRFVNSPIPAGSTIVACKITFTARQTSSGSLVVDWHCEDADDSAVPTDVAGVVTDRTLTTASVEWDIPAFADDATYDTPDLTDCLQEVIDRAGWDAGNAVSFIPANIVGTAERGASMSDFSTAESALLTVEYEPPASSGEIDVQVGAALDDVEEDTADGHMTMNASKLEANVKVVGLRFLSIAVPQGAIITSATLSVYANGSTASGATMTVKAIDEDDCAAFDTSPYNVSGRDLVGLGRVGRIVGPAFEPNRSGIGRSHHEAAKRAVVDLLHPLASFRLARNPRAEVPLPLQLVEDASDVELLVLLLRARLVESLLDRLRSLEAREGRPVLDGIGLEE